MEKKIPVMIQNHITGYLTRKKNLTKAVQDPEKIIKL